jgi:rsbT co-antagonist protein RsbR
MSDLPITVDAARIRRLITALSCASYDRFDSDEAIIAPNEHDEMGMLEGVLQLFIDELAVARATTQRALRESEEGRVELEDRLRVINDQRNTISELSSPVIDVWDHVLTLPIVGTMDSQRAAEMGDRLLTSVVDRAAEFVLLDLTGVAMVDTATASHLVRLAQGVRLLGAECILTGISPQVAQTLAMLGVEWTDTQTMRSLREGLRYCIRKLRRGYGEEDDGDVRTPARR